MTGQKTTGTTGCATSRRRFLATGGALLGAGCWPASRADALGTSRKRLRVAALFTEFYYRSHAHVILENFLESYLFNGKLTDPGVEVVAFYSDQFTERDMARQVAQQYKIPIFATIGDALCLGGKEIAVDGVLSIGEHGKYPKNNLGQKLYPRKRFFDEIIATMKQSGRFVPVFNDKHLSTSYQEAKSMVDQASRLGIPLMAGSSVPLAQRRPAIEFLPGTKFQEAVVVHGGRLESYGFHGLELLQSILEMRPGGETGIKSVECFSGDGLWQMAEKKKWSFSLAEAAIQSELASTAQSFRQFSDAHPLGSHAIFVNYLDGCRAAVFGVGKTFTRWNFAGRRLGQQDIETTIFYPGPWKNRNLFGALAHAIQHHFRKGQSPYPVQRTLLVTGVLEAAMRSEKLATEIATPELHWGYPTVDFRAMREMGDSWKILTEDIPQPEGVDPLGAARKRLW